MSTPATLPSGIYYAPSSQGIRYMPRFMLGGVRINLGIKQTLKEAIDHMYEFKIADLKRQWDAELATCGLKTAANAGALELVQSELTQAEAVQLEKLTELLERTPPHELSFNEPAMLEGTEVPAKIVTAFLNKLYGIS